MCVTTAGAVRAAENEAALHRNMPSLRHRLKRTLTKQPHSVLEHSVHPVCRCLPFDVLGEAYDVATLKSAGGTVLRASSQNAMSMRMRFCAGMSKPRPMLAQWVQ